MSDIQPGPVTAPPAPLIERLRRVPADFREWVPDARCKGHTLTPLGALCHEAANALEVSSPTPAKDEPKEL